MNIEDLDMLDLISCYEEITFLDDLELEYQIDAYSTKRGDKFNE